MAAASYNRKQTDLRKLTTAGYEVEMNNDDMNSFFVRFHGPADKYVDRYAKPRDVPVVPEEPGADADDSGDEEAMNLDPVEPR